MVGCRWFLGVLVVMVGWVCCVGVGGIFLGDIVEREVWIIDVVCLS